MTAIITIGAIISAISALPYISGLIRGKVRPKIASWFAWFVLALLLTGAAFFEGQMISAILSGVTALTTGTVLILGFKNGNRKLDSLDVVSLAGAFLGIAIWLLLDNPVLAIFVAIAVDIVAFVPTLVHGWTAPQEESALSFGLGALGASLDLIAATLTGAAVSGLAYPFYASVFNGLMVGLIQREKIASYLSVRFRTALDKAYNYR